jgi:hypothetical protein
MCERCLLGNPGSVAAQTLTGAYPPHLHFAIYDMPVIGQVRATSVSIRVSKLVNSDLQKSFLTLDPNHRLIVASCPGRGGVGHRHRRWGGMRWALRPHRTSEVARTVKSCGPDAPTLASNRR